MESIIDVDNAVSIHKLAMFSRVVRGLATTEKAWVHFPGVVE